MPFINNPDFVILQSQFKKGNDLIGHKLCGHRTALNAGELFVNETDILSSLNNPNLVFTTLGLYWDNIVTAPLVQSDIQFVYLDLSDALDSSSKMVLQAIGCEAEKCVYEPVVSNNR